MGAMLASLGPTATRSQIEAATYLDIYDLGKKHGVIELQKETEVAEHRGASRPAPCRRRWCGA